MGTWALRVVWLTLPLTAGTAASDAIATWDDAPRVVAAVLLFGAWGAVSVGLLAPRPAGLTIVRGIAPVFALLAIVALATGETRGFAGAAAIVATVAAGVLAMLPDYAVAAVNGVAYGDEMRVPLQVPPALFLGPLPFVRLLVAGALAAAPLLLADGRVAWGAVALVLGAPIVVFGWRSLHTLSRRWAVLVPAGLVIVDPMTLADAVLFMRRHVRALRAGVVPAPSTDAPVVDLRIGASTGTLSIELDAPIDLSRAARGRGPGAMEKAQVVVVAVTARTRFLDAAASRALRTTAVDHRAIT